MPELNLDDWLTPDQVALYEQLSIHSDARSKEMAEALKGLAETKARISRMEATADAREMHIRELTARCKRLDVSRLAEWPQMVRAVRAYYATDVESTQMVENAAFAVECANDFATAATDVIGPDAFVQDVQQP